MEGAVMPMDALASPAAPPMAPQPVITHDPRGAARQRKYRAKHRTAYLAKHRDEMREWRVQNPEASKERARAYRARNPDKVRSSNLKKKHGITLDQFNEMFNAQGCKCAICKSNSSTGKNWHVDHCHQAGNIRGILCHSCNLMIGHAGDKVDTLSAAVEYLK